MESHNGNATGARDDHLGSPKVEITARVLDIYSPLLRGERTGPHGSKVESHNGNATLTDPKWKATMETRPEHAMTTWACPKVEITARVLSIYSPLLRGDPSASGSGRKVGLPC